RSSDLALHCDDAPRTFDEQRAREAAGTRTDLIYVRARHLCFTRDSSRQVEIENEVLPETLARAQTMRGNDFAQRRQPFDAAHKPRLSAISAAIMMAATMLFSFAIPRPARSSAVP